MIVRNGAAHVPRHVVAVFVGRAEVEAAERIARGAALLEEGECLLHVAGCAFTRQRRGTGERAGSRDVTGILFAAWDGRARAHLAEQPRGEKLILLYAGAVAIRAAEVDAAEVV